LPIWWSGILSNGCSEVSQLVFGNCGLEPGDQPLTFSSSVLAPRAAPSEDPGNDANSSLSPGASQTTKMMPRDSKKVPK